MASVNLKEFGKWLKKEKIYCTQGRCDPSITRKKYFFQPKDIKYYKVDNSGFEIVGKNGSYWIYVECSNCGYGWGLRKLLHRFGVKPTDILNFIILKNKKVAAGGP